MPKRKSMGAKTAWKMLSVYRNKMVTSPPSKQKKESPND